jgi:hypothetical protein
MRLGSCHRSDLDRSLLRNDGHGRRFERVAFD